MWFGSVVFVRTRMAKQKFTDEKLSDVLMKTWLFKYPNWTKFLKTVLQKVLKNTFKDNVLFCKTDRFHNGRWWLEICFKQEISSTLLTLTWQIIWCSKIYKRLFFAKQVWYLHYVDPNTADCWLSCCVSYLNQGLTSLHGSFPPKIIF